MAEAQKGKILITGATSFCGSHIINLLLQEGWEVRGTVRSLTSDKTKALRDCFQHLKQDLDLVEADLKRSEGWPSACRDCEYVIHTACPVEMEAFAKDNGRNLREPEELNAITDMVVNGALFLINAAIETGVKRVVMTSSIAAMIPAGWCETFFPLEKVPGVYDPIAHEQTIHEEVWTTESLVFGYLIAKTKSERAAWKAVEGTSLELVCINPGIIFGPQLHGAIRADSTSAIGMVMAQPPPKPGASKPPGLVDMILPVVDVRDVARAHVKAMVLPQAAGNRYLIVTRTISAFEVSDICVEAFRPLGYDILTNRINKCMVGLLGLCDPSMQRVYWNWGKYPKIDNKKMLRDLVPEPIDMKTSIVDTVLASVATDFYERKPGFKTDKPDFQVEGGPVKLRITLA